MGDILLFHYSSNDVKPTEHYVGKSVGYKLGLRKLINNDDFSEYPYEQYKIIFNKFQCSNAPRWQKIVTTFLTDYILVLDEDREETIEALIESYKHISKDSKSKAYSKIYDNVAKAIKELPTGAVVVTTSHAMDMNHGLYKIRVDMTKFKKELQKINGDPERYVIDNLLEKCEFEYWTPLEQIITQISRATRVPLLWP